MCISKGVLVESQVASGDLVTHNLPSTYVAGAFSITELEPHPPLFRLSTVLLVHIAVFLLGFLFIYTWDGIFGSSHIYAENPTDIVSC